MLLGEMTWFDVEEYLKKDDRIIGVLGSCEQHGKHLPLGTDSIIPFELARMLSEKSGVPVFPPLNFGMSLHHMGFPGTVSLTPQTLSQVLSEIFSSLFTHGFRKVMVLNGHGGNIVSIMSALSVVLNEKNGLKVKFFSWWMEEEIKDLERKFFGGEDQHASACETSVMAYLKPNLVRLERAASTPKRGATFHASSSDFRKNYPHGAIGPDPTMAKAEYGEKVISVLIDRYSRELEEWE